MRCGSLRHSWLVIVLAALATGYAGSAANRQNPKIWAPDLGNGTYRNPVIHADYSDPDVVRVGDDFYMVASSFNCSPGLPVLHSRDLVNWNLIGHVFLEYPFEEFNLPQHGNGVWAPSIRHHNGEFYVYFGDPDRGIFLARARNPAGPWQPLVRVAEGKGWIDPWPAGRLRCSRTTRPVPRSQGTRRRHNDSGTRPTTSSRYSRSANRPGLFDLPPLTSGK